MKNQNLSEVKEFYEKTAKDYDKQYETPYWKLYSEITWNNIKKFLPKRKNSLILDAGGGTGYWTIKLAKLGYKVVLTDIAKNMLKIAERKIKEEKLENKVEIREVDVRDMHCFSSNYFDMALAQGDVVSYCLSPKKAIKELARIVKRKSPIIVSVDNKYHLIARLISKGKFNEIPKLLKKGIFKEEFELQGFTPEELKKIFESCGLKVVRIIGKPVLTQLISREERDEIIKKNFRKILDLELKLCDKPSLVGFGGHLEIVGIKQ